MGARENNQTHDRPPPEVREDLRVVSILLRTIIPIAPDVFGTAAQHAHSSPSPHASTPHAGNSRNNASALSTTKAHAAHAHVSYAFATNTYPSCNTTTPSSAQPTPHKSYTPSTLPPSTNYTLASHATPRSTVSNNTSAQHEPHNHKSTQHATTHFHTLSLPPTGPHGASFPLSTSPALSPPPKTSCSQHDHANVFGCVVFRPCFLWA